MERDEKLLRGIEFLQGRLKTLSELSTKLVFAHLAVTAFSITLAFQDPNVPRPIIQSGNILANILTVITCTFLSKDVKRLRLNLWEWHSQLGLNVDRDELRSMSLIANFYFAFAMILLLFSIGLSFFPFDSVVQG